MGPQDPCSITAANDVEERRVGCVAVPRIAEGFPARAHCRNQKNAATALAVEHYPEPDHPELGLARLDRKGRPAPSLLVDGALRASELAGVSLRRREIRATLTRAPLEQNPNGACAICNGVQIAAWHRSSQVTRLPKCSLKTAWHGGCFEVGDEGINNADGYLPKLLRRSHQVILVPSVHRF